jgi:hypothetical protein
MTGWWDVRYQGGGRIWEESRVQECAALVQQLSDAFSELGWEMPNDLAAVLEGGSVHDKMEARNALVELVGAVARYRSRMDVAYRGR